jgi:hypothetical protein
MRKITLSEIGIVAEAIAAVAVVVSLVYLAIQIKQNTIAVQASSYLEIANGVSDFQTLLAENKEVAEVFLRGSEDPEGLTPEESLRFEMLLGQLFVKYDVAVYFYRHQMIDDRAIEPYNRFILALMQAKGVELWWDRSQYYLSESMRDYLNARRGESTGG